MHFLMNILDFWECLNGNQNINTRESKGQCIKKKKKKNSACKSRETNSKQKIILDPILDTLQSTGNRPLTSVVIYSNTY